MPAAFSCTSSVKKIPHSKKEIIIKEFRKNKKYKEISLLNRVKSIEEFNAISLLDGYGTRLFVNNQKLKILYNQNNTYELATRKENLRKLSFNSFMRICGIPKHGKKRQKDSELLEAYSSDIHYQPIVQNYKIMKANRSDSRNIYFLSKMSNELGNNNYLYDEEEKKLYRKVNIYLQLLQANLFSDLPTYAYIEKRSYIDYLHIHCNSTFLLKFDIKEFFNSITAENLKKKLEEIIVCTGRTNKVVVSPSLNENKNYIVDLLVNMSTIKIDFEGNQVFREDDNANVKRVLAQGLELSPALSNIYMYEFDKQLSSWCTVNGFRYSRYCDDLIISSSKTSSLSVQSITEYVELELEKIKLSLNYEKTKVFEKNDDIKISNIFIRDNLYLPDSYFKRIFNILLQIQNSGTIKSMRDVIKNYYSTTYKKDNEYINALDVSELSIKNVKKEIVRILRSIKGKIEYSIQVNKFQYQNIKLVKLFNITIEENGFDKVSKIKTHPVFDSSLAIITANLNIIHVPIIKSYSYDNMREQRIVKVSRNVALNMKQIIVYRKLKEEKYELDIEFILEKVKNSDNQYIEFNVDQIVLPNAPRLEAISNDKKMYLEKQIRYFYKEKNE